MPPRPECSLRYAAVDALHRAPDTSTGNDTMGAAHAPNHEGSKTVYQDGQEGVASSLWTSAWAFSVALGRHPTAYCHLAHPPRAAQLLRGRIQPPSHHLRTPNIPKVAMPMSPVPQSPATSSHQHPSRLLRACLVYATRAVKTRSQDQSHDRTPSFPRSVPRCRDTMQRVASLGGTSPRYAPPTPHPTAQRRE